MPQPDHAKARIVIVEDHPMFRERLVQLIDKDPSLMVAGEADNLAAALEVIGKTRPDMVLMDLSLRGLGGLDLLKLMKAAGLQIPVLVLSMHPEKLYAERAIQAGARGYITKDEDASRVIVAVKTVLEGGLYLSPDMTEKAIRRFAHTGGASGAERVELLSNRELEIFRLFGDGLNTREIAAKLSLSENTICTHRSHIKEKLDLKNFTELYNQAARWNKDHEA